MGDHPTHPPVDIHVPPDGLVAHGAEHVMELVHAWQTAELPEGVVGGQTMLTAALDVDGSQVHTEAMVGLLEQMVGHLWTSVRQVSCRIR